MIAAWALGRMGDCRAIPPLQNAFRDTKYQSVRAHAARALGTLKDQESIPVFLDNARNQPDLGIRVACASSLGKLQVIEVAPDSLHILYIDSYPQSRKEMGLSLARLLGAEASYIEMYRSLDEDPGTALAQKIEVLRGASGRQFAEGDTILSHLVEARNLFAREQLEEGFPLLLAAIQLLVSEDVQPHFRQILTEYSTRMQEFGQNRMEYLVLAVVTLERVMK